LPSKGESSATVDSGLYQLVILLREARVIRVGRRGRFAFPKGYYVYTGSARRGLESRVVRHLRSEKRLRWHVDYLLRYGRVVDVKRYRHSHRPKCELNRNVGKLPGSRAVVPGFGSSDCECPTHLYHFRRNPVQGLG